MTLQEFKAWFDGFTEQMDRAPNAKQWDRIKKRVKEIDGTAVTERVFVDRYWHYNTPYYPYDPYLSPPTCTVMGAQSNNNLQNQASNWSSTTALLALGKADYQATA